MTEPETINIGRETLDRISDMVQFNDWMYERIAGHIGDTVLEVGCGIGNITEYLVRQRKVTSLDVEPEYIEKIRTRFREQPGFEAHLWDISKEGDGPVKPGVYDTVVCLNVLEHIKEDERALAKMNLSLVPGGKLVLLVPSIRWLYSSLDTGLDHHRRYSRRDILNKMKEAGLRVEEYYYLNLFGILGWLINGKLLRRKILPKQQLKLYSVLVPFFKFIEKITGPPIGLSIICIGRKSL